MKRYGFIYENIHTMENLYFAHHKAKKGKHHYHEVKMVDSAPEYYLGKIAEQLKNQTFQTSDYTYMTLFDGKKSRLISKLPYYPDRIVHWAIMLQTESIFLNSMIYHTYASIPGRGTHLMVKNITKSLKSKKRQYYIQFDIKKFFPSIDTTLMKEKLQRKFKDKKLLSLIGNIIDSHNGMPIGNYTSQYLANFYLNDFDHWAESLGAKYFRYMDDFVLIHSNKKYLESLVPAIVKRIKGENLTIKQGYTMGDFKNKPLDIAGYKIHGSNKVALRNTLYRSFNSALNKMKTQSIHSYNGWVSYSTCNNLKQRCLQYNY